MRRQRSNSVEDAPNGKSGFKFVATSSHHKGTKDTLARGLLNPLLHGVDGVCR